ncbi:MAG TPA: TlpA disulfide reductase family protein, partial [bacterium]|nr:TlpA disulfide reductase family protein [bacterium]
KPVRLADYRGKIVLMNFFATWCGPCVEETPSFDRLAARLKKDRPDIAILAASLDDDGWTSVDPFLAKMHAGSLPVVLDATPAGGGRYAVGTQAAKFKTFKLPETWVISRDGRILKRFIGAQDWDDPQLIPYLEGLDRGST